VDSSLALKLLLAAGHDVTAFYLQVISCCHVLLLHAAGHKAGSIHMHFSVNARCERLHGALVGTTSDRSFSSVRSMAEACMLYAYARSRRSACPDQICLEQVLLKCEKYSGSVYGLRLRQEPQELLL